MHESMRELTVFWNCMDECAWIVRMNVRALVKAFFSPRCSLINFFCCCLFVCFYFLFFFNCSVSTEFWSSISVPCLRRNWFFLGLEHRISSLISVPYLPWILYFFSTSYAQNFEFDFNSLSDRNSVFFFFFYSSS